MRLRCDFCGYDRTSSDSLRCPECGKEPWTDAQRRRHRRRFLISRLALSAIVLYAPQAWVFFVATGDSTYHAMWRRLFVVLPGFSPAMLVRWANQYAWDRQISDTAVEVIAGGITLLLLALPILTTWRRPVRFALLLGAMLLYSTACAFLAHAIYAA